MGKHKEADLTDNRKYNELTGKQNKSSKGILTNVKEKHLGRDMRKR